MVRLGSIFSNLSNKVRNFGSKIGSTFTKIAPKALHYGKLIAGGLKNLPGLIGTAAGVVHKGLDYADRAINSLPDSAFKSKLKSLEKKSDDVINKVESNATSFGKTAGAIGESANRFLNSVAKPPPII